jgi:hypothetical protein
MALVESEKNHDLSTVLPAGPDSEGEIRTGGIDRIPIRIVAPRPIDPHAENYQLHLEDWHQFNPEGMQERRLANGESINIQQ